MDKNSDGDMESELFEEILLGDFPGFEIAGNRKTVLKTLKIAGLPEESIPDDRTGVLGLRAKIYEAVISISGQNREVPAAPGNNSDPVFSDGDRYYKPVPLSKEKNGIKEKMLSLLIDCECRLLMGTVLTHFRDEDRREDAVYFGSLAIRKWSDYLQQAVHESEEIRITRQHLFAMLCDLSDRLREIEGQGADYLLPDWIQAIFPSNDESGSPVYPTSTLIINRLLRISGKPREKWGEEFVDLMSEIGNLIQQNWDDPSVLHELTESLVPIERAIFLAQLEAPFLKDKPEKIAEPGFTKEWITGFKNDLKDLKQEDLARIHHAVMRTETMLQTMPAPDVLHELMKGKSEVREIVQDMKSVNEYFPAGQSAPANSGIAKMDEEIPKKSTNHQTDEWVDELAGKFLTKDQVKKIFHINTNDAFVAFVERHGLSYHEASTHHHLYLRSDVMELLERIKKKRGS